MQDTQQTNQGVVFSLPEVGQGCTLLYFTDRVPATIIRATPKLIEVQEDNYERLDTNGMSDTQDYSYTANPKGTVHTFTLRQNGRWVRKGETISNGLRCSIGIRRRYYDYSF